MLDYIRNPKYCYHLILQPILPGSYNYMDIYINAGWVSSTSRGTEHLRSSHTAMARHSQSQHGQFPESPLCSFNLCLLLPYHSLIDVFVQKNYGLSTLCLLGIQQVSRTHGATTTCIQSSEEDMH